MSTISGVELKKKKDPNMANAASLITIRVAPRG